VLERYCADGAQLHNRETPRKAINGEGNMDTSQVERFPERFAK
jgi:hypothetical protein